MKTEHSIANGRIGILGFMFLVLFVGKVFAIDPVGNWSWWWITAPLWGGVALILGFFVFTFLIALIAAIVGEVTSK